MSVFLTVLLIVLLACLPFVFRSLRKQWRIYQSLKDLPTIKDQHWLMGHALRILKETYSGDVLGYLCSWTKLGKVSVVCLGPFFKLLLGTHPDSVKLLLGQNPKADFVYHQMRPWLGESLLTGNGKKWARTRRLLTPAFHFDILKPYVPIYEECAKEFVAILKDRTSTGEPFDVFPHISLLTLDVMLRCTCSFKSGCQTEKTHSPYVSNVYKLTELVMQRIYFFPAYFDWIYALMPSKYQFSKACDLVHKFSMDVITKRRAELQKLKEKGESIGPENGKQRKYLDFIDILLEAKDDNGIGLTNEEIRAEVDTFMFEGHDTTASGITWTLYNLALHPEHQQKCRDEVDEIFEDKDNLTWEDVKRFTYLKYCIKESLRMFPPVAAVARTLSEDCEFEGHKFVEGTWMVTDIHAIHHNPSIWEDPEEFDPMRFTPENNKGRHPNAFIPFSAGSRNCIGQEFALNEEIVVLSHILHNFEFSLCEGQENVGKMFLIILRPKDGLYLNFKIRDH